MGAAVCGTRLLERFEDFGLRLRRDSDPRVSDVDADEAFVDRASLYVDLAPVRELERVADEVVQDLLGARLVGPGERRIPVDVVTQENAFGPGAGREQSEDDIRGGSKIDSR
jgi:hypothetical protein